MQQHYDAIVIGAGQGGGPLAGALAKAGRRVALIERAYAGGTCVNEGCTPTKTMIASARVAQVARRAGAYGVRGIGDVSVDLEQVRERKRAIVASFRGGSERSLRRIDGLDFVLGTGRFEGPREVVVELADGGTRKLTAPVVIIDVGTRPAIPPLPGLDRVPYLTNATAMELDAVPEHLMILGGGYVGVEFAQMFRRFGSRVTIVQRADQLLSQEDADVAGTLTEALISEGVEVVPAARATQVAAVDGRVSLTVSTNGKGRCIEGSHLLVAVGRRPNTEALGLERAGVRVDEHGYVSVDDRLRTSVEGVYALGDVTGGPAFTHTSYDDYRILRSDLLEDGSRPGRSARIVAYTIFTDPQVGRVGRSEREAREAGQRYHLAHLPMTRVARALETDETAGLLKALVEPESGRILGAAVIGSEGGELAATLQVAMMGGISYSELRDAPLAHPTYAEALNNLFATVG